MFTFRRALIPVAALLLAVAPPASHAGGETFKATLTGAQQLPEPTNSKAEGTLEFKVSADGKEIDYTLTVKNLWNASGADVHLGSADVNGPLVVKLYPRTGESTKKGEFSGVLASGKITAADLIGPMTGSPLSDLIDELKAGKVYTNVHTNSGVEPPNSGPGNYRLGEIRGQLK